MPPFNRHLRLAALVAALLPATVATGLVVAPAEAAQAADPALHETIVFMRHGEKPDAGLGQLNCKGLNRALALPAVLAHRFGKPDAIFAPDPAKLKQDGDGLYAYVRPLATIEPTAIAAGLPVDTRFGYDEIDKLQAALSEPKYAGAQIFVAWEHKQIHALVGKLLQDNGGDPGTLPKKWKGKDFDSLYVVRIDRSGAKPIAALDVEMEGLDAVADSCPMK